MTVGNLLVTGRKAKDLTQADVAARLGMSRANYSHMETARRRDQPVTHLAEACSILDIDPLDMVQALGFKVRLPEGVRDREEAQLLERWRKLPEETKTFLRSALGL